MRILHVRGNGYVCARAMVAALALFLCLIAALPAALAETDGMVRVKLTRLGSPVALAMQADCDYYLSADPSVRVPAGTAMRVTASEGSLTLTFGDERHALGGSCRLMRSVSGARGVRFTEPALSNLFCGDLYLTASGGVITTVLHIYVEDFLYGALGYEMAPSSGPEALKAQAIVARNYVLQQKAARGGAAYDLPDTSEALTFKGYSDAAEYAAAIAAVDETLGCALYHGDSPATCYYCDSNGGQTESSLNALGVRLPYSAVFDDPYDLEGGGAKKTATLNKDGSDLHTSLRTALLNGAADQVVQQGLSADPEVMRISAIEGITACEPRFAAPSRLYRYLSFKLRVTSTDSDGGDRTVTAIVAIPTYGGFETWYDLSINNDNNETIWVVENDRTYEVTFRRSGHGMGMSQRGAQVMARGYGRSCAEILDYYYPGTTIRQLTLNDTTADAQAPGDSAGDAPFQPTTAPIAAARLREKTALLARAAQGADALTELPAGATVDVYGVQDAWAAVGSGGRYGFVPTDALASFSLPGESVVRAAEGASARVSVKSADLLQLPVSSAKVLGTLVSGDTVRLIAYTEQWALVTADSGLSGFMQRSALALLSGVEADDGDIVMAPEGLYGRLSANAGLYVNADDTVAAQEILLKGSYVKLISYNRAWAYVLTPAGVRGYVKMEALTLLEREADDGAIEGGAVTVLKPPKAMRVRDDGLALYRSYSTDSEVLGELTAGFEVQMGACNAVWACVQADGVTGFVLLSGLEEPPAQDEETIEGGEITVLKEPWIATVIRDRAPVYKTWRVDATRLAQLDEGSQVLVGAYNGMWACVRMDGVTGFMLLTDLELTAEDQGQPLIAADGISYLECDAITTADIALYKSADMQGAALASLPAGTRIHVFAFDERCAYVEYDGMQGFVPLRFLRKLP